MITFYLLNCDACKPRIHKYGPVQSKNRRVETIKAIDGSHQKPTETSTTVKYVSRKNSFETPPLSCSSPSSSSSDESIVKRSDLVEAPFYAVHKETYAMEKKNTKKERSHSNAEDEIIDPVGEFDQSDEDKTSRSEDIQKQDQKSPPHFLQSEEEHQYYTKDVFYQTGSYHEIYDPQKRFNRVSRRREDGSRHYYHHDPYIISDKMFNFSRRNDKMETASSFSYKKSTPSHYHHRIANKEEPYRSSSLIQIPGWKFSESLSENDRVCTNKRFHTYTLHPQPYRNPSGWKFDGNGERSVARYTYRCKILEEDGRHRNEQSYTGLKYTTKDYASERRETYLKETDNTLFAGQKRKIARDFEQ